MHDQNIQHASQRSKVIYAEKELQILIRRFYSVKHRCGRARFYRHVTFGFSSAREAAEYMFENFGPLPLDTTALVARGSKNGPSTSSRLRYQSIDRIDGRLGYEPGNLRYAKRFEFEPGHTARSNESFRLEG
jgi:hypothetical protein